jgi:hypothetical protein
LNDILEKSTHDSDPIYAGNAKIHPIYGSIALNRLIAVSLGDYPYLTAEDA